MQCNIGEICSWGTNEGGKAVEGMKTDDNVFFYISGDSNKYIGCYGKITSIYEDKTWEFEISGFFDKNLITLKTLQEFSMQHPQHNQNFLNKKALNYILFTINKEKILNFRKNWTKERITNMGWEEYNGSMNETFCNDLESINGIEKTSKASRAIDPNNNNNDNKERFEKVRQILLKSIDGNIVDDNGETIKFPEELKTNTHARVYLPWKIAFMYQNFDSPIACPFFLQSSLEVILGEKNLVKDMHQKIIKENQLKNLDDLLLFYQKNKHLLKKSQEENIEEEQFLCEGSVKKLPLNQILYGSPGTGKTYNTIDRALCILGYGSIVNQECKLDYQKIRDNLKTIKTQEALEIDIDKSSDRTCAKALFDYYHNEGQIEFVTFHQNYGYEEFVEGIKPDFDEENKNVKYEIKEGIFKAICRKANDNLTKSKINQNISIKQTEQMRQNIADFCKSIQEELWENETYDLGDDVNIKEITYNKNGDIRSFILGGSVTSEQSLTVDMLRRDYLDILHQKIQDPKNIKPRYKSNREHHGNAGYYFKLYKKFEKFLKNKNTTPQAESLKPYILIIDEINRGNISKIFGELITLIEPSKRIGADEELRVTLPYSGSQAEVGETKELFGVPKNLYIIGTMNTADRSITSLDTALRRRFEFVEMMPDSKALTNLKVSHENQDTEINLAKLLQAINDRIEFLYDREKTIGHAFFLSEDKDHTGIITLEQLKGIFQNKIIPLLQEYFYNDYEAIQAVLNDNGMVIPKQANKQKEQSGFIASNGFKNLVNDRGLEEKRIFKIAPKDSLNENGENLWDDPQTYINIYEG